MPKARESNVEFVTPLSRSELKVRFWERGVGPTLASGTGSASALVASVLTGRADREVTVHCPGGDLRESWADDSAPLLQEGPVERATGSTEVALGPEFRPLAP